MRHRCPREYPYSFLQNNRCCKSRQEGTTTDADERPWCNQRKLGDWSICCDGDSEKCLKKPCFDFSGPNAEGEGLIVIHTNISS